MTLVFFGIKKTTTITSLFAFYHVVRPKLTGADKGRDGVVDQPNVIEGENITLTCPVEGDPEPFITWLR